MLVQKAMFGVEESGIVEESVFVEEFRLIMLVQKARAG